MIKTGLMLKYFVASPTKDDPYGEASRKAMLAYANAIEAENPTLAYELKQWEIGCRHAIAEAKIVAQAKAGTLPPIGGPEGR